jgi:hypothetical protein
LSQLTPHIADNCDEFGAVSVRAVRVDRVSVSFQVAIDRGAIASDTPNPASTGT